MCCKREFDKQEPPHAKTQRLKTMYNAIMSYQKLAIASVIFVSALDAEAWPPGPTAMPPYTVSVFAAAPAGLSNPDSITTANGKYLRRLRQRHESRRNRR